MAHVMCRVGRDHMWNIYVLFYRKKVTSWKEHGPMRAWVWASSGSWLWTGRPGVLLSMGSQRVGHDWATFSRPPFSFLLTGHSAEFPLLFFNSSLIGNRNSIDIVSIKQSATGSKNRGIKAVSAFSAAVKKEKEKLCFPGSSGVSTGSTFGLFSYG